jgi:SAM-dependent methyltransferase
MVAMTDGERDDHGDVRVLPRIVPAAPGKPVRPEAAASRVASLALAQDPQSWSLEEARLVVNRYQGLASRWDTDRGWYRPIPLADALARGGPFPSGPCVEVGCGTGLLTPLLTATWPETVCVDITMAMLRRAQGATRLRADAARLPLADGIASAVVLADAPLFAGEVVRVLTATGVVLWCNALGTDAPHHVPISVVVTALRRACGGQRWTATTAEAGWGLWAVLRR